MDTQTPGMTLLDIPPEMLVYLCFDILSDYDLMNLSQTCSFFDAMTSKRRTALKDTYKKLLLQTNGMLGSIAEDEEGTLETAKLVISFNMLSVTIKTRPLNKDCDPTWEKKGPLAWGIQLKLAGMFFGRILHRYLPQHMWRLTWLTRNHHNGAWLSILPRNLLTLTEWGKFLRDVRLCFTNSKNPQPYLNRDVFNVLYHSAPLQQYIDEYTLAIATINTHEITKPSPVHV